MKLSAVVFIFWPEEEDYLEACLKTVSWTDEIIVIDNGATAKTKAIASRYTKKIYRDEGNDFALRHTLGGQKATGDWLLYVDADERVSARLAGEIKRVIASPAADAYEIFRENYFLGKKVRFGERYPDYVTRLFKKEKVLGWYGEIHESAKIAGRIGRLDGPLYHLTHRDIASMMRKTINFAQIEARLRLKAGHPKVVWWRLLRVILTEGYTRLVKYQGWRGGTSGWIDGLFQAFSLFIVYVRLWEEQRRPSLGQSYRELDEKILEEFK